MAASLHWIPGKRTRAVDLQQSGQGVDGFRVDLMTAYPPLWLARRNAGTLAFKPLTIAKFIPYMQLVLHKNVHCVGLDGLMVLLCNIMSNLYS